MRIKYKYFLKYTLKLIKFLDDFQIPYEVYETPDKKYKTYIFDLYEDQETYIKFKTQFPIASRFNSFKTIEYSKTDIENAEWLMVRNKNTKVQWEYDARAFKQLCPYKKPFIKELYYRHLEQEDILSVTKPVKWGTRQFFSGPNAADDIIFCSEKAKRILGNQWKGLEFWSVKKYNTFEKIIDLYQLFFNECLPIEALHGGELITCNGCGRKIIRISNIHQLVIDRKYLQDQKSVYKTGEVLTHQLNGCITFSINIVSQDFYRHCEKYKINNGMVYEPVNLMKN